MSNEVATIHQQQKPLTAGEIQQQVNTIQHVMHQVMKKDTHFGVIPGCKQPSLYKPGAEKIMATFRLSADPEVTDLSDDDEIRYLVKVTLKSPNGHFVGAGIGECSSNEEKYKWRRAVCKEEFDDTEPSRKREKWFRGWDKKPPYKQQQVRTEAADQANTILKMAKKRALVDAVLTATAASDIFTQDVEDVPEELREEEEAQPKPEPQAKPQPKAAEGSQVINEQQARLLRSKAGDREAELCEHFGVEKLEQMPFEYLNDALEWVKQ